MERDVAPTLSIYLADYSLVDMLGVWYKSVKCGQKKTCSNDETWGESEREGERERGRGRKGEGEREKETLSIFLARGTSHDPARSSG